MKCPICKTILTHRIGKFGPFDFCKNKHGSISVQGTKIVATGNIFEVLAHQTHSLTLAQIGIELGENNLEVLVRRQMASVFGVDMTELDLFVEGGADAAQDEPDHWMNGRPY